MSNNEDFKPFISSRTNLPELGLAPILMGVALGIVFGASSLYLALKVGMTVSASIPIAVLSITLFKGISAVLSITLPKGISKVLGVRRTNILENNIVQTTGSAGESIAFGVAVTMPALLILGYPMEVDRIMIVASLGGLLGILMMIPLRNSLIVKGHKELPYPEGTACAEVLIVGEKGGTSAIKVFTGFFAGLGYKFLNAGSMLWPTEISKSLGFFKGATVASEVSPELLGVGYIIGPRIASIMVAGGVLSSFVLIPAIVLFGEGLTVPLFPGTKLISEMGTHEIWKNYVLYIGAGAVAAGGIISLVQSLPTIISSASEAFKSLKKSGVGGGGDRLDRDIPMNWVLIGCALLVVSILVIPSLNMNLIGAVLIIVAGFLFVTVSSRLTGTVGSSSNPISGMTVATLLITSLVFLTMGWTTLEDRVIALTVAAIVCVAASNGGTTSQDLKTGFIVGGTPWKQQVGILIGAFTSALVIGYTLGFLNDASTIWSKTAVPAGARYENVATLDHKEHVGHPYNETDSSEYGVLFVRDPNMAGLSVPLQVGQYLVSDTGEVKYLVDPGINGVLKHRDGPIDASGQPVLSAEGKPVEGASVPKYEAPKARLMSLIIDGILSQQLPWGLVLLGVFIAILMELCGVASLPFAVGVYLPLSASMPIFIGGMIRWGVERWSSRKGKKSSSKDEESSPGILFSSGLIAGGSICGILLAFLLVNEDLGTIFNLSDNFAFLANSQAFGLLMFAALAVWLFKVGVSKPKNR
jgi:putative OPT family oligopeptide transporter